MGETYDQTVLEKNHFVLHWRDLQTILRWDYPVVNLKTAKKDSPSTELWWSLAKQALGKLLSFNSCSTLFWDPFQLHWMTSSKILKSIVKPRESCFLPMMLSQKISTTLHWFPMENSFWKSNSGTAIYVGNFRHSQMSGIFKNTIILSNFTRQEVFTTIDCKYKRRLDRRTIWATVGSDPWLLNYLRPGFQEFSIENHLILFHFWFKICASMLSKAEEKTKGKRSYVMFCRNNGIQIDQKLLFQRTKNSTQTPTLHQQKQKRKIN